MLGKLKKFLIVLLIFVMYVGLNLLVGHLLWRLVFGTTLNLVASSVVQ